MGHNSVVSGYPKSTGILRVVNGTLGFGVSHYRFTFIQKNSIFLRFYIKKNVIKIQVFTKHPLIVNLKLII